MNQRGETNVGGPRTVTDVEVLLEIQTSLSCFPPVILADCMSGLLLDLNLESYINRLC